MYFMSFSISVTNHTWKTEDARSISYLFHEIVRSDQHEELNDHLEIGCNSCGASGCQEPEFVSDHELPLGGTRHIVALVALYTVPITRTPEMVHGKVTPEPPPGNRSAISLVLVTVLA
jgi:hypothetical protein